MPESLVADREAALDRFRATPSGREKPGRFWKVDVEALALDALPNAPGGTVSIGTAPPRAIVCDLATAQREHPELLERALGRAVDRDRRFVQLALAYTHLGAFVYLPADCHVEAPIAVTYTAGEGESIFPHTVVLAERGARASVIERIDACPRAFVCGIAEIVTEAGADVTCSSAQFAPNDARVVMTRAAKAGRDAVVRWNVAELGAELALADVNVALDEPGADAAISTLFFPSATQHVDVVSAIDHRVGDTTSETLVKSAATGAGQGRYLGTIRIAAHAQHSSATLRDDALLLSERAHIDSVPALEIAANDVKAYHGATIGALDDDQIFYMESRGVERNEAERMIALGFFEPVLDRFPSALQDQIREALVRKVQAS